MHTSFRFKVWRSGTQSPSYVTWFTAKPFFENVPCINWFHGNQFKGLPFQTGNRIPTGMELMRSTGTQIWLKNSGSFQHPFFLSNLHFLLISFFSYFIFSYFPIYTFYLFHFILTFQFTLFTYSIFSYFPIYKAFTYFILIVIQNLLN